MTSQSLLVCPWRVLTQRRKDAKTQGAEPKAISGEPSRRFVSGCGGNPIQQFFAPLRLGFFALKNLKADRLRSVRIQSHNGFCQKFSSDQLTLSLDVFCRENPFWFVRDRHILTVPESGRPAGLPYRIGICTNVESSVSSVVLIPVFGLITRLNRARFRM